MARTVVSRVAYPALLVASLLLCAVLLARGVDAELTVGLCAVATALCVIPLERVIPFREQWNQSHGDVQADVIHMLVTALGTPVLYAGGVMLVLGVASHVADRLGSLPLWPTAWPLALQVTLALVVAEFGTYWFHRFEHQVELGWRFHATHHSVERLYWLNGGRFHPVDGVLSYAIIVGPLALLGVPGETLAYFSAFAAAHGMIQHANLDLRLGPLNYVVSGPQLHRWHHSRSLADARCNYGGTLIVWDVVFRTWFLPKSRDAPAALGIEDMPEFPKGYWGQLLSPFSAWRRLRQTPDPVPVTDSGQAPQKTSWTIRIGWPVIVAFGLFHVWDLRPILDEPAAGVAQLAPDAPFAVIELFTSEGCSSCPPADALLSEIAAAARRDGRRIFPLAFHVDYWDGIGWPDPFAAQAYTARQKRYARVLRLSSVYTPQMIVNGESEFVGSHRGDAREAIRAALTRPKAPATVVLRAERSAATLAVSYRASAPPGSVLNLAVVERGLSSVVVRGENTGRTLEHDNVVRVFSAEPLTESASGVRALELPSALELAHCSVVAYVQDPKTLRVLGAAKLDLAATEAPTK